MARKLLNKYLNEDVIRSGDTLDEFVQGDTNKFIDANQVAKLDAIEENADVTDATSVDAAGAVMETDYDANTILAANSDDTPVALTVADNSLIGRSGGNIASLDASAVRALLNVEDNAAADQIAVEVDYSNVDSTLSASNVKAALDELCTNQNNLQSGLYMKETVDAAETDSNINISVAAGASITVDGIEFTATARLLLTAQTDPTENGVYVFTPSGAWARAEDSDGDVLNEVQAGTSYFVKSGGTSNGSKRFTQILKGTATNDYINVDTDSQTYTITSDQVIENASGSSAGLMSASDYTKLEGIEANAKDDQIASEVDYDNISSGLTATDVQAALDELNTAIGSGGTNAVNKTDFDANTIMKADVDDTPTALTVAEGTIVGRATGGSIGALTPAEVITILGIEAGATADQDASEVAVADTYGVFGGETEVQTAIDTFIAGGVFKDTFNPHTVLAAVSDDTPVAVTISEDTLLGRKTGGNIAALTAAEIRAILNVEDGATAGDNKEPKTEVIVVTSAMVMQGYFDLSQTPYDAGSVEFDVIGGVDFINRAMDPTTLDDSATIALVGKPDVHVGDDGTNPSRVYIKSGDYTVIDLTDKLSGYVNDGDVIVVRYQY